MSNGCAFATTHQAWLDVTRATHVMCREQTMHWAIWQQMKSPPKGFEDIVRTHFRQRKKHVSAPLYTPHSP